MIPSLSDYATSRSTFLAAAEATGATIDAHPHPLLGPDGEQLAVDVARYGAPRGDAHTVVLVSSGLHGVEGHAGNGLQLLLIDSGRLERLPDGVAVVLLHAVNPFGFAWARRVDHANIDVNRNFVDYRALPTNPRYGDIDAILNPVELDLDDQSFLGELLEFWQQVGDDVAFRTISGGQYSYPHGVQFGGQDAAWSRSTLERIWAEQLVGADHAVALDIHTGLGPLGVLTVFQTADDHEPAAALGTGWFSNWLYRADRTGSVDHGLMGPGLDAWADGRLATAAFVIEFGTHEPTQGVSVFRADNWLHHHGDARSDIGRRIRSQMQEFFFVDDPTWRGAVADQGMASILGALDGVERNEHR